MAPQHPLDLDLALNTLCVHLMVVYTRGSRGGSLCTLSAKVFCGHAVGRQSGNEYGKHLSKWDFLI